MAHERRDEPAIRLRDAAVEKGPDMIAADRPWVDQPHVEIEPLRRQRERREPARERSDERRGGLECDSTGSSRWSPYHKRKHTSISTMLNSEHHHYSLPPIM